MSARVKRTHLTLYSAKETVVSNALPIHPTLLHPLTGLPLRALGVSPRGKVLWPMMGASEDAGADSGADGADSAGADKGGDKGGDADKGTDLGFPPNTPVVDMTLEQQVAYHKHQSRKHETRSREWQQLTGGKTPEQIKADLAAAEKIRQDSLTDQQRQVEEAKNSTRAETVKAVGASAARTVLEISLGHDAEKNDQSALLDTLDMSKLVNEDGTVNTAKVTALIQQISPSDKDKGTTRNFDFGGGNRNTQSGPKSVAQVMQERADARAAKQK